MSKFLVFTDLHQGNIMPDAQERMVEIIQATKDEQVDFVVNLGDFISNFKEGGLVATLWEGLEIPHYIVAGNHDFDLNDEAAFRAFYHLERTYYHFEDDDFLYLVVDTNYFRKEDKDCHYAHGNYYGEQREYVSEEQLNWLAENVRATQKRCIVLSHAQLNYPAEQGHGGCGNYQEIHKLLTALNEEAGYTKICMAINGHNHTDSCTCWDNIYYLDMNSASNQWMGDTYELLEPNQMYSQKMHDKYPYLKYVAPYEKVLYSIITYDARTNRVSVKGKKGGFIGPTPQERGHEGVMGGIPITASISDREIILD